MIDKNTSFLNVRESREILRSRQLQAADNVQRMIAYNNRRILIGLKPLDMAKELLWDHNPIVDHRDRIKLNTRKS